MAKPAIHPIRGAIAQLGERVVRNDEAVGSSPTSSTMFSRSYPRPILSRDKPKNGKSNKQQSYDLGGPHSFPKPFLTQGNVLPFPAIHENQGGVAALLPARGNGD
jgi:hypothetical protein